MNDRPSTERPQPDLILLLAALATGFVVNPLWWVWLGVELRKENR